MAPFADAIRNVFNGLDATKNMEIGEMPLHARTIEAILSNWGATKYNGSQDVRPWLTEIEEEYRIHGIPEIQMTDMAVRSTDGEVNTVLTAMYEAKVAEGGKWSWEDFKESVIKIEGKPNQLYQPRPWTPLTNRDRQLQGKCEGSVSNATIPNCCSYITL